MKRRGFTLIEVLVALTILFFLAVAITTLFKTASNTYLLSNKYFTALSEGQSQMEEIRALPFAGIASKSFASGEGQVTVRAVSYDLLEIKLTYNWDFKRKPIELFTLRSIY